MKDTANKQNLDVQIWGRIDKSTLEKLEAKCAEIGMKKSPLIRMLILQFLGEETK